MVTPVQASRVNVTVVYATGGANFVKPMLVPGHQTLAWAVNASGVAVLHPELTGGFSVGVRTSSGGLLSMSARVVPLETKVAEGMRIEVYIPVRKEALEMARKKPGTGLQDGVE